MPMPSTGDVPLPSSSTMMRHRFVEFIADTIIAIVLISLLKVERPASIESSLPSRESTANLERGVRVWEDGCWGEGDYSKWKNAHDAERGVLSRDEASDLGRAVSASNTLQGMQMNPHLGHNVKKSYLAQERAFAYGRKVRARAGPRVASNLPDMFAPPERNRQPSSK